MDPMKKSLSIALLLALHTVVWAQTPDWAVSPNATVRVDVKVTSKPEHPDLGIMVMVPDGGLLPGKFPTPDVRDAAGKAIEHIIVGHNPADVMGIVFAEQPEGSTVSIFFKGADKAPAKPNSKLFPSLLLYTKTGNASIEVAKRLSTSYPPAPGAHFAKWPCIGSMVNPFGLDSDFVSWYVGAILSPKKEKIYLATVSSDGSEFWIDDKMIHAWNGAHGRMGGAKGQQGKWLDLSAGIHRVDYYHFASRKCEKPEAQLVWKREGIPLQNTNNIPELAQKFALSGEGTITAIQYKDGRAGAVISGHNLPSGYVWTGKNPLFLFTLDYSGQTKDTTYTWEFSKNSHITQQKAEWLVVGNMDNTFTAPIALLCKNAAGVARASNRMWSPWTPVTPYSLNVPEERLLLRKALFNMAKGIDKGDPCADWTADHWQLLSELLEPYRGGPLLYEIFNRSFEGSYKKVAAEYRWILEDRFIETLRLRRDNKMLLSWIDKFEKFDTNNARKFRWKDERVCAYLFDIGDLEAARKEIVFLKEIAMLPDQVQIAALRQGDLARAQGNIDEATKFYKEAQEKYRSRNKTGMAGGRTFFLDPKNRAPAATTNEPKVKVSQSLISAKKNVADWKIYTVHGASMYTTILSFIAQDSVEEVFQKLCDWENSSPLSKLDGEYQLAEAKVYIYTADYQRAINALATYRKNATLNALLADGYKLEIECYEKIGNRAKMKELAQDFMKRFPGHPYANDIKWIAEQ